MPIETAPPIENPKSIVRGARTSRTAARASSKHQSSRFQDFTRYLTSAKAISGSRVDSRPTSHSIEALQVPSTSRAWPPFTQTTAYRSVGPVTRSSAPVASFTSSQARARRRASQEALSGIRDRRSAPGSATHGRRARPPPSRAAPARRPQSTEITGSRAPWPIARCGNGAERSSSKPGTVGTNPLSAMSPAGRGRPAPKPSAYVITAPCENPPSTVRAGAIPVSSLTRVEPGARQRERLREGRGIGIADLANGVPVCTPWRKMKRASRSQSERRAGSSTSRSG